jgi:peptidoglycan/LPS O-acetylase OafA/YrhL
MTPQSGVEVFLALAALLLLGRDLRRAWRDELRRPISLLVAALVTALLIGAFAGARHPSPWLLLLPTGVLAWEVARGWRQTPRCRVWEAGVAAFTAAMLFAVAGLAMRGEGTTTTLLALAAVAGMLGLGLLWRSRRTEPRPSRIEDPDHYERRGAQRKRR